MVTVEEYRLDRDSMGEVKVPSSAYYRAETQRAFQNFPISGLHLPREFIWAMALIKLSAARANMQLGLLDAKKGEAIVSAAKEIMEGSLYDQFVVDVFQTGSGTSSNMNMNEVIANRAIELLGAREATRRSSIRTTMSTCASQPTMSFPRQSTSLRPRPSFAD